MLNNKIIQRLNSLEATIDVAKQEATRLRKELGGEDLPAPRKGKRKLSREQVAGVITKRKKTIFR